METLFGPPALDIDIEMHKGRGDYFRAMHRTLCLAIAELDKLLLANLTVICNTLPQIRIPAL